MHPSGVPRVAGLVLAAGSGSRYGMPKSLVVDASGEAWLARAALALEAGGCDPVLVVLGAGGAQAEGLLRAAVGRFERPDRLRVVHAEHWRDGLSASLEAGLAALQLTVNSDSNRDTDTDSNSNSNSNTGTAGITAVAVIPVDVPDLSAAVVRRLIDRATPEALRQAHFAGRPGHPVVIGRAHWAALRTGLAGDAGARPYLVAHEVTAVACDDLGTGLDVDQPPTR